MGFLYFKLTGCFLFLQPQQKIYTQRKHFRIGLCSIFKSCSAGQRGWTGNQKQVCNQHITHCFPSAARVHEWITLELCIFPFPNMFNFHRKIYFTRTGRGIEHASFAIYVGKKKRVSEGASTWGQMAHAHVVSWIMDEVYKDRQKSHHPNIIIVTTVT